MDTMNALLTGSAHTVDSIDTVIAARLRVLLPNIVPEEGDALYEGSRCDPDNIGWRFRQKWGTPEVASATNGEWDREIEGTYHEAARAAYYYRYDKDWG